MKFVPAIKGFTFAAGEGCRQRGTEDMKHIPIQSLEDMPDWDSTRFIWTCHSSNWICLVRNNVSFIFVLVLTLAIISRGQARHWGYVKLWPLAVWPDLVVICTDQVLAQQTRRPELLKISALSEWRLRFLVTATCFNVSNVSWVTYRWSIGCFLNWTFRVSIVDFFQEVKGFLHLHHEWIWLHWHPFQ